MVGDTVGVVDSDAGERVVDALMVMDAVGEGNGDGDWAGGAGVACLDVNTKMTIATAETTTAPRTTQHSRSTPRLERKNSQNVRQERFVLPACA